MNSLANGPQPEGPTDRLCPFEEPNEAKQAYPRRDGRQRPRWKDGSHLAVENTHANESRCNEIVFEANHPAEPLVTAPQLFHRSHEHEVSTRDRPARAGADARIEESAANGEVRLALRPYGRKFRLRSGSTSGYGRSVERLRGPQRRGSSPAPGDAGRFSLRGSAGCCGMGPQPWR